MAIDYQSERLLTVTEAAKSLPGRPCVQTVWRWISSGCRGVKLESILVGDRRYTSAEALDRFVHALNAQRSRGGRRNRRKERAAQIEAAEKELSAEGL